MDFFNHIAVTYSLLGLKNSDYMIFDVEFTQVDLMFNPFIF